MTIKFKSTFVRCEPSQIVEALVGLKDIRVLAYRRVGRDVELVIEQTVIDRSCPTCGGAGIIEILPTRGYVDVAGWIDQQPLAWKHRIRFGALDMSNTYAAVYTVMLPRADQIVDPFHCVQLANRALDEIRRRVKREQKGHRGRRHDALYRVRRVLLTGEERLDPKATQRLRDLFPVPQTAGVGYSGGRVGGVVMSFVRSGPER